MNTAPGYVKLNTLGPQIYQTENSSDSHRYNVTGFKMLMIIQGSGD